MKKNVHPRLAGMAVVLLVFGILFFSCKEEEDPEPQNECSSIVSQLNDKLEEFSNTGYNCEKMKEISQQILDLLNKGKNCDEVKKIAADEGFSSVEEYINDLKTYFRNYMSDCPS